MSLFEEVRRADTDTALADLPLIHARLQYDPEFFIQFFLAEELTWPVPQFHMDLMKRMQSADIARMLLAIPRGHAKTTLAKLHVVWRFLFTEDRFGVYLQNTAPFAKNACRDIMGYLRCLNFEAVFGAVEMEKESETDGLWIFQTSLPNGKKKRCILRAAGAGQSMRGINIDNQRPDFTIVDDLEDRENTATEDLQKKLDAWVFGTFLKALRRNAKVIWIGNMIRNTTLLARLSSDPEWDPIVLGAIVTDPDSGTLTSLWPELWPFDALIKDFRTYQRLQQTDIWFAEMMNMPGVGEHGFSLDGVRVRGPAQSHEVLAAFLTMDPSAFKQKEANDDVAIAAHQILHDGTTHLAEVTFGKFSEYEAWEEAKRLALTYNAWVWGIEAVAAQTILITLFTLLASTEGLSDRLEFVPLQAGARKSERIGGWVAELHAGVYTLPEDDFAISQQLLAYDRRAKDNTDDIIDACAYGPLMQAEYLGVIMQIYEGHDLTVPPSIQQGIEVYSV